MSNVIQFSRGVEIPSDLMTFKDVYKKYSIKYCTLYKYTRLLKRIPLYKNGGFKVSESDIKAWLLEGKE